ncbi:hypothetical protein [Burkholderia pseudomallei]|nr:hypothetical protein [Burkholderia pseudomallei]
MKIQRHPRDTKDNPSLDSAGLQHVINTAVVAAILFDPTGVEALLDISDAEVGRLFKTHLMRVIGVASALNMEVSSVREEDEKQSNRTKRRGWEFPGLTDCSAANIERYSLVLQGKLLPIGDFCQASGITERRLSKDVASGRLFSVEFEASHITRRSSYQNSLTARTSRGSCGAWVNQAAGVNGDFLRRRLIVSRRFNFSCVGK